MVKLSEEEKTALIKAERERRRIARLKQVRQQAVVHAKTIREVVNEKKQKIIQEVRSELHEEIQARIVEIENSGPLITPSVCTPKQKKRKSMSSTSAKKHCRRRQLTDSDLKIAQKRNAIAMQRLRDSKQRQKSIQDQKLQTRRNAAEEANRILKESANRILSNS